MLPQLRLQVQGQAYALCLNRCRQQRRLRRQLEDWRNIFDHGFNADVASATRRWYSQAGWRWTVPESGLQGQVGVRCLCVLCWLCCRCGRVTCYCYCVLAPLRTYPSDYPFTHPPARPPARPPQGPAASWAQREAASCALLHFQLGFSLDLYAAHEFSQLYWYCDFLLSDLQCMATHLHRAAPPPPPPPQQQQQQQNMLPARGAAGKGGKHRGGAASAAAMATGAGEAGGWQRRSPEERVAAARELEVRCLRWLQASDVVCARLLPSACTSPQPLFSFPLCQTRSCLCWMSSGSCARACSGPRSRSRRWAASPHPTRPSTLVGKHNDGYCLFFLGAC